MTIIDMMTKKQADRRGFNAYSQQGNLTNYYIMKLYFNVLLKSFAFFWKPTLNISAMSTLCNLLKLVTLCKYLYF